MARPLRVEYPGAYYYVINRGNAGKGRERHRSQVFIPDR